MSISDQIRQAASVNIFKLADDKSAFVGHPFYFDYDIVMVLVADARKHRVGGIPQGTFLLAFYDNDESEREAVLLRALRPTKLPTDQDVIKSMIEYYKDNLRVSGESSQLDEYTRYEFSFSGLECRVLGTFYQDDTENLVFGADLENFYSAHNYSVYKPTGPILEKIVNFREGDAIPGQVADVRIGVVRYSSSRRYQDQEKTKVPFYVAPADFLGKRTALFGMTRTGKSNTVKKIIQATVEISDTAQLTPDLLGQQNNLFDDNPSNPFTGDGRPKFPVGQIIFDINGEYANANLQDEGTAIFEMYKDRVTRFSILDKPGFRVMKTNFYEDIEAGFEILASLLEEDDTRFVQNFRAVDLGVPEDKKADNSFLTRHGRHVAAYKCCLYAAGFKHSNQTIKFQGTGELNALSKVDPSKGISFDQAIYWFSCVWEAMGNGIDLGGGKEFFSEYKKNHDGREWADEDLKSLLVMLTRKRTPGGRNVDCNGYLVLKRALDLHTASIDIPYADAILELLRKGKIVIADLSQGDPTIIQLYSEKICHRIFTDAMSRFIQNQSNNFIQMYFEEAHNLFPKKEDKNLSQIYNRLAKEGAKLHIGLIYATQEVSSISANILKNTQNWFVAHLNNTDELKEVEKYYDYEDFSQSLARFSASTDKGFIRVKTYSNSFTVPVQVDRFAVNT
jgi:DNA helicase HerA-like ATPase